MVNTLKLPVGIDSFEKIRRNGFYYIDKTNLIEQILMNWGEVTLFTRPRRFGKTLNMSMLKSFFEIGADVSLFEGLYIAKNKELCDAYMGKYPVIFLTLKGVEGDKRTEHLRECRSAVCDLTRMEKMEMKDIEGTAYTLIAYSKALRCKVRLVIWQNRWIKPAVIFIP